MGCHPLRTCTCMPKCSSSLSPEVPSGFTTEEKETRQVLGFANELEDVALLTP